jgi:hypothetical protein
VGYRGLLCEWSAKPCVSGINLNGGGSQTGYQLWVHPTYDRNVAAKDRIDLAVVQMASKFALSSTVTVIALAPPNCAGCESLGAKYVVSGYGSTVSNTQGSSSTTNQVVAALVVSL